MKHVLPLLFILSSVYLNANNLSIANVSLTGQNTTSDFTLVQFDLSWDNSWRLNSRRDAAWIFVKYKIGGAWKHATINYVDGDATNDGHTEATGSLVETPSDGMGVFVYRDADGNGTNTFTGIQLRWNYGADGVTDDDIVDIQVFGIEMVYVPTGTFAVGDAGIGSHFTVTTINTGSATTVPGGTGSLGGEAGGYPTGQTAPDNNTWPNGYNAFYCMKYEVSQGQYVAFLNTLTGTQQSSRVSAVSVGNFMDDDDATVTPISSNGVKCITAPNGSIPGEYAMDLNNNDVTDEMDDGENLACNWPHYGDISAYLDWSALRLMTNMEFEKACRGTSLPVDNEYAWGSINIYSTTYTFSSKDTESESITNMGTNTGNAIHDGTNGSGTGPLRNGIFAASATNNTREETGGSFYGIMEMSGNLREILVIISDASGRQFTGIHGNGELDSSGDSDVINWPTNDGTGSKTRGGSNGTFSTSLKISSQSTNPLTNTRNNQFGIRGVRTAL